MPSSLVTYEPSRHCVVSDKHKVVQTAAARAQAINAIVIVTANL